MAKKSEKKSVKLSVSHEWEPTVQDGRCACGHPQHDHKQGANRCCEGGCTCSQYKDK